MADENVQIWDGIDQEDEYEFDEEGVAEEIDTEEDETEDDELPVEFGVNFKTGQMTGGKVTGLDAIKVWAWNALRKPRYVYEQNTWGYGSELEDLIGRLPMPEDYIKSEAKRMVTECLQQNKYIEDVKDFSCKIEGDTLTCAFTMVTTFGEVKQDVAI